MATGRKVAPCHDGQKVANAESLLRLEFQDVRHGRDGSLAAELVVMHRASGNGERDQGGSHVNCMDVALA